MKYFLCVVGARPNFMKIAPLCRAFDKRPSCRYFLVHTGQHYDRAMSDLFFDELEIPRPHANLAISGGSHAQQTAAIMSRFEPVLADMAPDAVVVVGDVNSTLGCALVSAKAGVPVAHVEAGLRSFDRSMPEEINRMLTDAISDYLFVSEHSGLQNLMQEGAALERVHFVGNVMIDSLLRCREQAKRSGVLRRLALAPSGYALLTLHRPANVDSRQALESMLTAIERIQEQLPVVFPVHPRTRSCIERFGLGPRLASWPNLVDTGPLGYLDFLCLMDHAAVVLTDSGGIQEETTALGVPCLTLRDNTERPVTLHRGTNRLVGRDPERIVRAFEQVTRDAAPRSAALPDLWDGQAAERIAEILLAPAAARFRGGRMPMADGSLLAGTGAWPAHAARTLAVAHATT